MRKNVLYAQPESGRRGLDWFLDESSLLTDPFIHIVRLTKPGNPEPRTVCCMAESLAQFSTSLLHYYIPLSLLLFLPQGVMTIILLTAKKHIPEIMTNLALELWT